MIHMSPLRRPTGGVIRRALSVLPARRFPCGRQPGGRGRRSDPPPAAVPGLREAVHHRRADAADGREALRRDRAVQPGEGHQRRQQGLQRPAGTRRRAGPVGPAGRGRAQGERLAGDARARGRTRDPRPAAGARRSRLPTVRERVPAVRVSGRLRDGDRAAAGGEGASGHRAAPAEAEPADLNREPVRHRSTSTYSTGRSRRTAAVQDTGRGAIMTETVTGHSGSTKRSAAGYRGRKNAPAGLTIERIFTTEGVHPYDEVTWERRDVVQQNWKTGETVFEQRGVEFPDSWSVNASTIVTT